MSEFVIAAAAKGAATVVEQASELLNGSIAKLGAAKTVAFPDTAYYLPVIYGFTGKKVESLGDLSPALDYARNLLSAMPPSVEALQNIGVSSLIAEEIIEGVRFAEGEQPDIRKGYRFNGPIDDVQLRAWGVQLADGTISGGNTLVNG